MREKLEEELDVVTAVVQGHIDNHSRSSTSKGQMYVRLPGHCVISNDMLDTNFISQTPSETTAFARQLTDELACQSMDIMGSLAVCRGRKREQLLQEKRILDLREMLRECEPRERAMYLAVQAVVCILHLENRVELKSIKSIL